MSETSNPLALIMVLGSVTQRAPAAIRVPICETYFSIGRDAGNQLSLPDDSAISRHHCAIKTIGSTLVLEDLNSSNGTYLNGRRIQGAVPLPLPARVIVGQTRLAVAPVGVQDTALQGLEESTYSDPSGILIPSRSRFERRTEAFLVVDVVDSTPLLKQSESQFASMVVMMGRILEHSLQLEPEPFLQCIGDGFFACFGSARTALETGLQLAPSLAAYVAKPFQLSIALHWGSARLSPSGERIGQDVYGVFALENLRHLDSKLAAELTLPEVQHLITMTHRFRQELEPAQKQQTALVGHHPLKGLEGLQSVFRWTGIRA